MKTKPLVAVEHDTPRNYRWFRDMARNFDAPLDDTIEQANDRVFVTIDGLEWMIVPTNPKYAARFWSALDSTVGKVIEQRDWPKDHPKKPQKKRK